MFFANGCFSGLTSLNQKWIDTSQSLQ